MTAAPRWAVQVRVPFTLLVLSGARPIKTAWLLSRGAQTSPFQQGLILDRVHLWDLKVDRTLGSIWDALTLPFALWRNV